MDPFSLPFLGAAVVAFLAMRIGVPWMRARWWGLVNLVALALAGGWKLAAAAAALSLVAWVGLFFLRPANSSRSSYAKLLLLVTGLSFVFYKGQLQDLIPRFSLVGWCLVAVSFSYVCLRLIDAIRAIAWERAPLLDPLSLSGFLLPFHMLLAGPIASYQEHLVLARPLLPQPLPFPAVVSGISAILTGLVLKAVVADAIRVATYGVDGFIIVESYAQALLVLLYLYFDFWGYSIAATGIGRMLGVPTPVNFHAPLLSPTITAFWGNWHASLGEWAKRNIYLPLQIALVRRFGIARANFAGIASMTVAFAVTGLWHRLDWRFLAWAAGMALLLGVEKLVRDRFGPRIRRLPPRVRIMLRWLGPCYVIWLISLGLWFTAPSVFRS